VRHLRKASKRAEVTFMDCLIGPDREGQQNFKKGASPARDHAISAALISTRLYELPTAARS
jgi:hypothetical protein